MRHGGDRLNATGRVSAVAHIIALRRTLMQRSAVSLGRGIPENGSDGLGGEADFSYWQCYEDPVFGRLGFPEVWPSGRLGLLGRPGFKAWVSEVTVP